MTDTWLDDMLNWLEQSKAKQAKLDAQNIAMPDVNFWNFGQTGQPVQGGVTGPGTEQPAQGRAPGAAGGQARGFNPDTMSWDEYQRGQDEAFRRRSAIWDTEENAKNAQEDAARLRAGQKLPGTGNTAQYYDNQSPESGDFDRAQALAAQASQNGPSTLQGSATPTPPLVKNFQSPGKMERPKDPGENYSFWEHAKNTLAEHLTNEKEMTARAWAGDTSPEVQDWMNNKAMMLAAGSTGVKIPKPGSGFLRVATEKTPKTYQGENLPAIRQQPYAGYPEAGFAQMEQVPGAQAQMPGFIRQGEPYGTNYPAAQPNASIWNPPPAPETGFSLSGKPYGGSSAPYPHWNLDDALVPFQKPASVASPEMGYFQGMGPKTYPPADIIPSAPRAAMSPQEILRDVLYPASAKPVGKAGKAPILVDNTAYSRLISQLVDQLLAGTKTAGFR